MAKGSEFDSIAAISSSDKRCVYIFVRSGTSWTERAIVQPPEGNYDSGLNGVELLILATHTSAMSAAVYALQACMYRPIYSFQLPGDATHQSIYWMRESTCLFTRAP